MTYVSNFKAYHNVLVSSLVHDFSRHVHEHIPQALVVEWMDLITRITRVVHPGYQPPPVPSRLSFETESIHSDGPYPSSENFYTLDYVFMNLLDGSGTGLSLNFENYRQGGDNPIGVETLGLHPATTSYINKDATEPRASIYLTHGDEQTPEIEAIIAQHSAECLARRESHV